MRTQTDAYVRVYVKVADLERRKFKSVPKTIRFAAHKGMNNPHRAHSVA